MLSRPLKQELLETERWLIEDLGFRIMHQSFTPATFGNSTVVLECEAMRLAFLRDRGFTWAELAPPAESKLWDLSLVLEAVEGARPRYSGTFHDAALLFRDHLAVVRKALGADWPATKQELERRGEERLQAAMARHPVALPNRVKYIRLRLKKPLRFLGIGVAMGVVLWLIAR